MKYKQYITFQRPKRNKYKKILMLTQNICNIFIFIQTLTHIHKFLVDIVKNVF